MTKTPHIPTYTWGSQATWRELAKKYKKEQLARDVRSTLTAGAFWLVVVLASYGLGHVMVDALDVMLTLGGL